MVYLIEQRHRGPFAGQFAEWVPDPDSPVFNEPYLAEKIASEWNHDFPGLEHRVQPYDRMRGEG